LAALLFCTPAGVDLTYVHGRPVVEGGRLTALDQEQLVVKHNRASLRLVNGV
jgi:8-oxoguanine deaminase